MSQDPVTHSMGLEPSPFDRIQRGLKTIEARLTVDKHDQPRTLKVGDFIRFTHSQDPTRTLFVQIKALLNYPSFEDLVKDFLPSRFFGKEKLELLASLYRRYPKERREKFGVLGIKIEVQENPQPL